LAWKVEFDPRALAELGKLDRVAQKRIVNFLQGRVMKHTDPRELGKALTGEMAGFWRYRIGDYRAVCFLDDKRQVAKVMRVAHRKEVYR
jgi:mRNA interferase RelE/StbE